MNLIVKNKVTIHAIIALSETLDVIIAIIINLITQSEFNFMAPRVLIPSGILVLLVAAHIACSVIQHNASLQARNKKLLKAFQDHGGYDMVAEEMIGCIKHRDFRTIKDLRKMVDFIEK